MAYNVSITENAEKYLSEIVKYISDTPCSPKAINSLLKEFLKAKIACIKPLT